MAVTENAADLSPNATLIPEEYYRETFLVDALMVITHHASDPHTILKALFSDEELQWIKTKLDT